MLNDNDSSQAASQIIHAAHMMQERFHGYLSDLSRPSIVMKPKIYQDGDSFCCLFGENIQQGIVGWGETPEKAMGEFDRIWWWGDKKEELTPLTP